MRRKLALGILLMAVIGVTDLPSCDSGCGVRAEEAPPVVKGSDHFPIAPANETAGNWPPQSDWRYMPEQMPRLLLCQSSVGRCGVISGPTTSLDGCSIRQPSSAASESAACAYDPVRVLRAPGRWPRQPRMMRMTLAAIQARAAPPRTASSVRVQRSSFTQAGDTR
jgi:hypothetical protein